MGYRQKARAAQEEKRYILLLAVTPPDLIAANSNSEAKLC